MNALRRTAVLIGLTACVVVGSSIPASATFTDSVSHTASMRAATVAAPTGVSARVTRCHPVHPAEATVSWTGSTTTLGVTGYRITAHLNNGTSAIVAVTGSAARSFSTRVDRYYLQFQPRVSVSTLTSYGWTAESAMSAGLSC